MAWKARQHVKDYPELITEENAYRSYAGRVKAEADALLIPAEVRTSIWRLNLCIKEVKGEIRAARDLQKRSAHIERHALMIGKKVRYIDNEICTITAIEENTRIRVAEMSGTFSCYSFTIAE